MLRLYSLTVLFAALGLGAEPPKVSFYLIESTMQTTEGRNLPASLALIRRAVDREQGRIEESVITLRNSGPAQEFLTIVKPEGRKAKISCTNCEIDGEGEFTGPEWEWTGFKFTTRMKTLGQKIDGEDHFLPDGMTAEKRILGEDGRPRLLIHETGRSISAATYDLLRARLLPANKP